MNDEREKRNNGKCKKLKKCSIHQCTVSRCLNENFDFYKTYDAVKYLTSPVLF